MPNELKNALKASTNHTMSRQLPVAGSSTVSVMVWTISGIVLASCGGGGGGGAGGSGLSVSGSGSNGGGGGDGPTSSGPTGRIARVVDGPVKDAAVYFDIDGDGEVSDSERAEQTQNNRPMYITDANGYVNAPIAFEGHFFIANVDNATDTATGDTLSGEYQSLSTGGIATPITDLITDQIGASGSGADAQGVLDDIFGTDGLVTVADIRDAGKYKIQEYDVPKPTLPSDPTNAEEQAQYDRDITKYKTSIIMKSSLALSEIDKDEAFTNLESSTARVDALKQIFDDDPNNGDSALMERIDARVDAGREILGISKPLAQPDSSVSPINEDSVFRFPQASEDIFGFDDPNGNSDDAAASRFTGIYVKSSVDFPQDGDAHTVDLLYNGSPLSRHEGAGSDSLPGNLPPEAGFYYVSSENLSRLSISPSDDDSGTLEVEYYVFDGEQWSDKASLEITVRPVDDPATDVAVGTRFLTAIDENTDLTGGMKVADLDVTDADGAPHGLVVGGTNAAFFRIRNDDELWLVLQEGQLDYETTPTLTVQVEVSGAPAINTGTITVTVNNVNDNPPVITHSGRQIPLLEGTFSVDTNTRYRYTASDADGGTSGLTLSGDPRERFQIDTNGNLQIKANSEFDYENPDDSSITLTITAADSGVGSGNQPINTTETVTIRLRNINDNPPVITQSGRQVPLDEGTFSSDTNTGYRYTVSDADGVTSTLSVSGDPQNRFAIDASGNLQIKAGSEFNYESLDEGAITLTITATDSGVGPGSPAVTDTETVIITFGDVNEAPTATSRASISTNDHTAYALEAVDFGFSDVDAGDDQFHSVIITSLPGQGQGTLELNGNPVSINTPITFTDINNGRLVYTPNEVSQGQITYNAAIGYRVVDDGDGAGAHKLSSATETLVIGVGANQSATGVAVGTRFLTAIDENTVTAGMKVADLTVDDADGPPHRLEVRGDNTGFFEIRNEDELWLVVDTGETLDYETTPTLAVQVGVSGVPDITPVNITVAVNNVNDNAPEISLEGGQNQVQNPLTEGIFPNTPTDTGYSYTASDADGGTSTLRVSGDAQDRFAIDASGKLQIKAGAEFDYETPADRAITLTITATDSGVGSGISPAAATQEVIITFGDANDAPTATPKLGISTNDNAPYTFSAVDFGFRDEDVGDLDNQFDSVIITSLPAQGRGTLELNGNPVIVNTPITLTDITNGLLVYTPNEVSQGQITYNAAIGYRVVDDGDGAGAHKLSSATETLVIGVGANQSATGVAVGTRFLTAIDENTVTTGMKVADLTVDDADGPPHRLEVRGDNTGFFEIRNEDELWLVVDTGETLDYETTPTLAVQVGVSGVPDITPVNITVAVNNLNDNAPMINLEGGQNQVQNPLTEGVFPNTPTNTGYNYRASDADGGAPALSVSGDPQNRFAIDASGKLQIKAGSEFNYETPADQAITLTITATDSGVGSGNPPAASTHEVTIIFRDVNDAPTATPRAGLLTADNLPYPLEAVDFGFRDEDVGDLDDQFHSVIITSLPGAGQGTLALNGASVRVGDAITFAQIDAGQLVYTPNEVSQGQITYNAAIGYRVRDDGDGANKLSSDAATLVIAVGQNQSATAVALGTQSLGDINENTVTAGMKVADLTVTDADGAPHRLAVGGAHAGFFEIRNEDELWLMLQEGQLDYETTPTLTVHVEVAGANPAVRTGNITVAVNNVNDNLPMIEQLGSQIPLDEGRFDINTLTGYRYTASDADGGAPTLSVSGDPQNRFAIDASGKLQIKAGATFDYETPADRAITLTITATDSGVGSGSSPAAATQEVTITFGDANDAPTATPKLGISTNDHAPYTFSAVDFGFRDVDADDLDDQFHSVIITFLPVQGQGTLALNGVSVSVGDEITFTDINNGRLIYIPNEVQPGQITYNAAIGYRVVDDGDAGGGNGLRSDTASLVIAVGQNQSATAVVLGTQSLGDINENTVTAGMKVADLTVTDDDGAPHRLVVGGTNAGFFEIRNEDELWLMLQEGQLDYETTPTLTVHVEVAGASPAVRTGNITVTVNNVNDNLPMIEPLGSQIPLDEGRFDINTFTGYRYRASDADGGAPTLSVSGDPQNRFAIDASGKLQIKAGSEFNYESLDEGAITLTITATDSGVGAGNQTAADTETVIITFRDVNIDSGDADFSIASDSHLAAGTMLTATEVTPDPDIDDAVYSYQWYHIGTGTGGADVDIAGATSKSYTIADTDEGKRIGVRVSYAEDSFQSDGITPTGTETITARLPTAVFRARDIGSELIFDNSGNIRVARISAQETSDILILDQFNNFNMVDSTNPLRATSSGGRVAELSGDDKDYFMFVVYSDYVPARIYNIFLVTRTEFDYENPADKNGDNDYRFTLSFSSSGQVTWTADYVLTITDDNSDNFRDYPRDVTFTHTTTAGGDTASASVTETGYRLKFTSLEDAIRAYSGVDDALGASATFGGAVVDSANPHRAIVTFEVAGQADIVFTYELSGDDVNDVLLVQDGNDASLVTVAGLDYENPVDEDEMNTYSVVETITTASPNVPSAHRTVSKTYTLSIIDNPSDYSVEVYESQPLYRPIEIDSVDLQGYELTEGYLDNLLFTIDEDGQVWWKAVSDYEAPRDNGHDNIYEIELSRTNNGQTDRVQVNIKVKDIGIGPTSEEDYVPRFFLYPIDIADEHLPRAFIQHLIHGETWKVPETGPVTIQYSIDTDQLATSYNNNKAQINRFHSVLDAALLSFEQAANLKFIEVAHNEDDDDTPYIYLEFSSGAVSIAGHDLGGTDARIVYSTDHIGGNKIYTAKAQRTIIHELGHALGLDHPFDEGGRHNLPGLFWPGDLGYIFSPLSIMSYNRDLSALQSADIEALQFLYGAPGTNFMGVESIMEESRFASRLAVGAQDLNEIDENTNLTAGIKVADITVTDRDGGAFGTIEAAGGHAEFFEIRNSTELWLVLEEGETLENITELKVYLRIVEKNVVRTDDITITVNDPATDVALGTQDLTAIDENTVTGGVKAADLDVTDADGAPHGLVLSGANAGLFAIRNDDELWLVVNTGETLDYETTRTLAVQVGVSGDSTITPVNITVAVNDVNEAPTATPRAGISTNDHRAYPLEAMDFGFRDVDADDLDDQFHSVIITFLPVQGQGTLALNGVSVSVGDEITFTDINNGRLIYIPNEVQPGQITYNAAIGYRVVDDGDAGGGNGLRSDTASLVIAVGQNQSATAVVLGTQSLGDINENTVTAGMKVADLTVTDDDGAPHRLVVGGTNAGFFEIRNEAELWLMLQEGQLDYETTPTLTVHVEVAGANPAVRTGNITVAVNNVNDNLPMIEPLGSQIPLDEGRFDINTFTGYRYRASDADGGAPTLSVSGDPQNRFAIDASGKLQIKAGSEFNYESLDEGTITLTITATDSGVGAGNQTAADTETVIITFRDVNIDSGDADFSIASDSHLAAGTMLTATEVTPDPDIDDAVYSYQWYHIGAGTGGPDVDIAGATSKSYTIADTDEGKRIGVRVSYAEDSFQSDGITPTGTETITARLPTAVFRVRDIRSEIIFDHSSDPRVARISAPETSDILILDEVRYFSRVDSTNPLRATRSTYQVAELSGDDKDYFMFVLYRNDVTARDIFLVTRTELDYENPADKNGDNDYHFTLSISFYDGRLHSTADYVLTITDDNYDNFRDYPRDVTFTHTTTAGGDTASASVTETGSRLKFTSLEDAIRAYSGIDHALGASETFGGAVVDSANPHRAIVTFEVAGQADIVFTYELSGDDANEVLLVQDGNDASLVTVAGLDYENPVDEDEMNTYSVVETITTASPSVPSAHRVVSKTYTLSVIDNPSDYSVEVYESHPLYRPIEIDSVDLRGYELTEGYLDNPSFTIDEDGQVWWTAVSDYEDPRDGNRDNLYEIELSRTNNGQIDRVQVDIRVKNIGIDSTSEEDYSPIFRLYPTHIADDHLPSEFVQHLILGYTWKVPKTGPVIIQYSIDTDVPAIIYNNNQVRIDKFYSVLEEALLSFEEAANLKFIEVAHGEAKDDAPHIYLEFSNSNIDLSSAIFNIGSSDYDHYVELTLSHLHVGNIYSDRAQWTIIHELGHALGLAHPFSEGGRILPGLIWPGDENYRYSPLSVMSYDRSLTALQSADIEALQFLYGAPGTNFMGVESIMAESQFARELAIGAQDLTEIDENTDLTAGIKVADITVTDRDGGVFGTLEAAGTDAEFFEIRNSTELWLVLEEYETLEDIATLEVHVQLVEKNGTRTNDITIMVNDAGSSGAEGSSGPVGDATGDSGQIKIDETVDEGQSVIANLIDLDLGAIDLTEITVGGGDKDQVQIRPTQNGGVLEFVSAPDFEAPEDDDEDNVYEITLYDDLTSIEVDITVIDIPEI